MRISYWSSYVCTSDLILLRKVPVAEHDRAAGDQQLAFPTASGNHPSVRVQDQSVVAGADAADRQGPPFLPDGGVIRLEECADVGFRGAIQVVVPWPLGHAAQGRQMLHGKYFASEEHDRKSTRLNSSH